MKEIFYVSCFILGLISHTLPSYGQVHRVEIKGTVTGYPDGYYLKLYDSSPGNMNVLLDSAKITKGQFTFLSDLKSSYKIFVIIDDKNGNFDYRRFYAEAGTLSFSGARGALKDAKITGSSLEDDRVQWKALSQKYEMEEDGLQQVARQFIYSHPGSIISGSILETYAQRWGKDSVQALFNTLTPQVQKSDIGKRVAQYLEFNQALKVGDNFIDFSLPNKDGELRSLSAYKGKYVLLYFWGSWCAACRAGNPSLVKTYLAYKDKGFEVLGVSLESESTKAHWLRALKDDGIPWENLSDFTFLQTKPALIYGIYYTPSSFLINPQGQIIAKDLSGKALQDKLATLLADLDLDS